MARSAPDPARLERLLRESFEFAPGPDMGRLQEIEERLLRASRTAPRARRTGVPWWALLLLAGGAAAAAWWAGEQRSEQIPAVDRFREESTLDERPIEAPSPAPAAGDPVAPRDDGYLIDRRESGQQ